MECPICGDPLKAHATVIVDGGQEMFVGHCGVCGRFALGPKERQLAQGMGDADRFNLMARLEMRSIPAEVDGTVLLRPHHFKKGAKEPAAG